MQDITPVKLIANVVGGLAVVIVAGWMIVSLTLSDAVSICAQRYQTVTELGYRNQDGARLTPPALQARAGFTEFGMLENTQVVDAAGASGFEDALAVRIAKGTGSGYSERGVRGGASFVWTPHEMGQADAACLSYSVYIPEKFPFAEQGMLPGLFAGRDFEPRGEPVKGAGSALRVGWGKEGLLSIMAQFANENGWQYRPVSRSRGALPRGRWALIEQEIILNKPGSTDGAARLWLDGKLIGEQRAMIRRAADIRLSGVLADISYGSMFSPAKAPADTEILISPLSIRWQNKLPSNETDTQEAPQTVEQAPGDDVDGARQILGGGF